MILYFLYGTVAILRSTLVLKDLPIIKTAWQDPSGTTSPTRHKELVG